MAKKKDTRTKEEIARARARDRARARRRAGSAADDRGAGGNFDDIQIASGSQYIGVPGDYKAKRYDPNAVIGSRANYGVTFIDHGKDVDVPARYRTGDELKPAGWSPEKIAALQTQLARAGLLTGSFRLGKWDKSSADAYATVLGYANQSGMDKNAALQSYLDDPITDDDGSKRVNVIRLTADADLRTIAEKVATQVLGEGFSPAEVAQFIMEQHAAETGAQTAAFNAGEAGGTFKDSADPSVAAEAFARRIHPDAAVATDRAAVADNFLKLLSGSTPTASY